jgi:hypothetical protein
MTELTARAAICRANFQQVSYVGEDGLVGVIVDLDGAQLGRYAFLCHASV